MIFENGEIRCIEINNIIWFVGKDITNKLGYKNSSEAISMYTDEEDKILLSLETQSDLSIELDYRELGQRGGWLINEDGVFDLIYNSKLPQAKQFKKKVKAIISQIQRTGKFDSTENNIMLIEDETERNLTLTIYNLKQTLTTNPNDMLMQFAYNSKVTDLTTYKQSRELKLIQGKIDELSESVSTVQADNELIKGQQLFICDRTSFHEKMNIMSNKFFGRDKSKAYNALFAKMKLLGSFDVYARRKNEWDKINEDRIAEGKDPYKESTLKGKVNYLDVIDKNGKWELCSEAYKTIETEEYTSNTAR